MKIKGASPYDRIEIEKGIWYGFDCEESFAYFLEVLGDKVGFPIREIAFHPSTVVQLITDKEYEVRLLSVGANVLWVHNPIKSIQVRVMQGDQREEYLNIGLPERVVRAIRRLHQAHRGSSLEYFFCGLKIIPSPSLDDYTFYYACPRRKEVEVEDCLRREGREALRERIQKLERELSEKNAQSKLITFVNLERKMEVMENRILSQHFKLSREFSEYRRANELRMKELEQNENSRAKAKTSETIMGITLIVLAAIIFVGIVIEAWKWLG